jgi:chromosome segregation ATPase
MCDVHVERLNVLNHKAGQYEDVKLKLDDALVKISRLADELEKANDTLSEQDARLLALQVQLADAGIRTQQATRQRNTAYVIAGTTFASILGGGYLVLRATRR